MSPSRDEMSRDDPPDALQQAANAIWGHLGGNEFIHNVMEEGYAAYYEGDHITDSLEEFERFQARVWMRVLDFILTGED